MGEEFLDRVGRSRNFCAIKESSGDINRVHLLARDYPHIQLLCGMDDQALEFFAWGARSWVCAGSNFLPEEHIALYEACAVQGDFRQGAADHVGDDAADARARTGRQVHPVRQARLRDGRNDAGPPRPPLKALNKDDKRQLEQVVRVLKRTIAEIEAEG
jgi:4-hydroxy-tetrahydrodipicolinate synthase